MKRIDTVRALCIFGFVALLFMEIFIWASIYMGWQPGNRENIVELHTARTDPETEAAITDW